jgi:glycine cleavage system H protein
MKKYSKEHEWVEIIDGKAIIGVSVFAAKALGDVTYVELPEVDDVFTQDEQFGVIESVKSASDVFMPIGGTVTEVNEDLDDAPEIINESPEDKGWICKLSDFDTSELDSLMTAEEYDKFTNE